MSEKLCKPGCDCLNTCGDDPRVDKGTVEPCPMKVKQMRTRTVLIGSDGVSFGNFWASHEKITGIAAAELNSSKGVFATQYRKWLAGESVE